MKAYLFIETGEERRARLGEYYLLNHDCNLRECPGQTSCNYPILSRHEIEIPEVATDIYVGVLVRDNTASQRDIFQTPVPRPKKKVKKWRWVIATKKGRDIGTTQHITEEDLYRHYPNQAWYHRIDETEIEVEE